MAKFTKPFYGVPNGEIYPVQYEKGDDIPPELLEAAKEADAVGGKKGKDDLKDGHPNNPAPEGGSKEQEGDTDNPPTEGGSKEQEGDTGKTADGLPQ